MLTNDHLVGNKARQCELIREQVTTSRFLLRWLYQHNHDENARATGKNALYVAVYVYAMR